MTESAQARERMLALTRRALRHLEARSTDQAADVLHVPVASYAEANRYALERARIFGELPLALALSVELPRPGDYLAIIALETPVLLVRGEDGVARAFVNACRHRGARVCAPGAGNAKSLRCPYHSWVYELDGRLRRVNAAETFGAVDTDALGLLPLACAERAGLLFVRLTGDTPIDIDTWLGDFAAELATLDLANWTIYAQRELPGPGWKASMDGYLEVYHHDSLHTGSVGRMTIGNLLVHDTFGPHQRLTFGRATLRSLVDTEESSWDANAHVRLIHNLFPSVSISGILGGYCLVSQLFPGPTPDRTTTRQTVLVAKPPETDEERAAAESFSAMVLQAVRDEDYATVATIQDGLAAMAGQSFVIGRNEPAVQHYHRMVARYAAASRGG